MIIDAHCHASPRWYQPVESLLFEMDGHGVERAVLIPLIGSTDSQDMQDACRRYPGRLAFVAAGAPTAESVRMAAEQGACGMRMRISARAGTETPLEAWAEAERLGLAISCLGPAASFTDDKLQEIAGCYPRLQLVLEHLGGLARPDVGDRAAAVPAVLALAALPNVSLKLPGLGQLSDRLPSIDGTRIPLKLDGVGELLAQIAGAFGANRLLWGSDYPPVSAREGYGNALCWTRDLLASRLPATDIAAIFGGNARRIFTSR